MEFGRKCGFRDDVRVLVESVGIVGDDVAPVCGRNTISDRVVGIPIVAGYGVGAAEAGGDQFGTEVVVEGVRLDRAVTALAGAGDLEGWHYSGVGDFDSDGRSDVLWAHDGGAIGAWITATDRIAVGSWLPIA